jgi:hypothetical protein
MGVERPPVQEGDDIFGHEYLAPFLFDDLIARIGLIRDREAQLELVSVAVAGCDSQSGAGMIDDEILDGLGGVGGDSEHGRVSFLRARLKDYPG